jgi:glycosyltransferase involved in cell wall biosynthesis
MVGENSITVIVPVHNRQDELRRALQSLSAQTDQSFDVVVCDDGSTSDLTPVVEEFNQTLQIKFIRIENFGGPARPRNVAIEATSSCWLSFLDSDDWWFPERISTIRQYLEPDIDIVYHPLEVRSNYEHNSAACRKETIGQPIRGHSVLEAMLHTGNPLPTSGTIVRTNLMRAIGGFYSGTPDYIEDFDAWLRLAAAGAKFRFVPRVLGAYWVGFDNISSFSERQYHRELALFQAQLKILPEEVVELAKSSFNYLLGSYCIRLGRPGNNYLSLVSFRHTPWKWVLSKIKVAKFNFYLMRTSLWRK